MNHSIKVNRSKAMAPHVPSAQAEIDNSISPMLLDQLTSAQLAEVRRCMDAHWHKARAYAEHEALTEGGVWDGRRAEFREFARA